MLLRPGKRATLARPGTAIVIEGFLRSGNTFSVAAFVVANGPEPHVARHLHGGQHVVRAVRLGLPTLVLIRDPEAAVGSYLVRRPTLTPRDALLEYVDFYRTVWPVRDGFVVGVFDRVVSDFGGVLSDVNHRFGTSFAPYLPTPENDAAAFALVEEMNRLECRGRLVETHVGRPSAQRDERTREIRSRLQAPRTRPVLLEAQQLYRRFVTLADSSTLEAQGGTSTSTASSS